LKMEFFDQCMMLQQQQQQQRRRPSEITRRFIIFSKNFN
jgi:hypothetical protein